MASTCMQLCQKCSSLLRSKTMGVALQYSTQVQRYPAVWRSIIGPVASSMLQGRHASSHIQHRGNLGFCHHSHSHAKALTTQVKNSGAGEEFSGADVAPFKSSRSQQLNEGMSMTDGQLADLTDLDAAPRLSPYEEISDAEAVRLTVPSAMPPASLSLRDYVNHSETLSKLVQLGVNLWQLERRPNVGSMLLRLDFQTDVAPRLLFLKDIGVEDSRLGYMISHNPFILSESLENLQARVAYLRSMKFSSESVASMVARAPYLLNFSVKRLDNRLAFYQQKLGPSPQKTRDVVARLPRLLCGSLEPIKENLQVCKLELGFRENDIQHMVTKTPKILTANKRKLTQIFHYVHNTMNVPHSLLVKFPQVLNAKYLRIKERHLFLQYLGKAQYEPTQPNYVSLDRLVSLPDETFCTEVASATLKDFELFQKTL